MQPNEGTQRIEPIDDQPTVEEHHHPLYVTDAGSDGHDFTFELKINQLPQEINFDYYEGLPCTVYLAEMQVLPENGPVTVKAKFTSFVKDAAGVESEEEREVDLVVFEPKSEEEATDEDHIKALEFTCMEFSKPKLFAVGGDEGDKLVELKYRFPKKKPEQTIEQRCALVNNWLVYKDKKGDKKLAQKAADVAERLGQQIDFYADADEENDPYYVCDTVRTHLVEFMNSEDGLKPIIKYLLEMLPKAACHSTTNREDATHAFLQGWKMIKNAIQPTFLEYMFQQSHYMYNEKLRETRSELMQEVLITIGDTSKIHERHQKRFDYDYYKKRSDKSFFKCNFDDFKPWESYAVPVEEEEDVFEFTSDDDDSESENEEGEDNDGEYQPPVQKQPAPPSSAPSQDPPPLFGTQSPMVGGYGQPAPEGPQNPTLFAAPAPKSPAQEQGKDA